MSRSSEGMRRFWDDAAKRNAAWYVDTSLSFENPDMDVFLQAGRTTVDKAYLGSPQRPRCHDVALEIGSGLGRNCLALAARFGHVVGIDISPEMIERSRELIKDDRVEFRLGQGADLSSVAPNSVDFVMSFTVFQHIPDVEIIQSYLREASRVLRSGGVLAFQWNNQSSEWRWKLKRVVLSSLRRLGLHRERHDRTAPEFFGTTVSLDRIQATLVGEGMELLRVDGVGSLFCWAWAAKP